jgi:hypothetical protein
LLLAWAGVSLAIAPIPTIAGVQPAGADTQPWTVSATPTTNVSDGQRVTVSVHTTPAFPLYSAEVALCRGGATYTVLADINPANGKCSSTPVSTSGDIKIDKALYGIADQPDGAKITFHVGSGVAKWSAPPSKQVFTYTCDVDNPCTLVVQMAGGIPATSDLFWTTPITYGSGNPLEGCNGPANGLLQSGGSDRMSQAWIDWTLAECHQPGAAGAPSSGAFSGEGTGVESFASGNVDVTYSASGYDDKVGFAPPANHPNGRRAAVNVPVAVNAAVLALGNGYFDSTGQKVPFGDVKITQDQLAALLGGGFRVFGQAPYLPDLQQRNPIFGKITYTINGLGPQIVADGESSTWALTNASATLRPQIFKVPADAATNRGEARPATAAIGTDPTYSGVLDTFSGMTNLNKVVEPVFLNPVVDGAIWVFTDLATATALGLTPVSIENANGDFVAPTPETLAAAIPTMKKDSNGILIGDPTATAPAGSVQPYPLTMVEYAMAPAEPLYDNSCVARTDSQALLTKWLTFISTTGQAELPEGFVPLTPSLSADAAAAIPNVGASPVTGDCAPKPTTTTTTTPPTTTASGGSSGSGSSDTSGGSSSSSSGGSNETASGAGSIGGSSVSDTGSSSSSGATGGASFASSGAGTGAAAPPAASGPTSTTPAPGPGDPAAQIAIPDFAGSRSPSGLVAILSLVGVILLASVAALASAGRSSSSPTPEGGSPHLVPDSQMIELQ